MPVPAATAAERAPRRARYLIPMEAPRRGETIAAFAVAVLLAHLLFAQFTLMLSVALCAVGRISRWRSLWLAVPAGAGLLWVLAIGPATALAGFTAGPRQVAAYIGGIAGNPGRMLHLGAAFTGAGQWLPRQLPIALILAAAEAGVARWLSWLHTDADAATSARPGLIVAVRRRYAAATVRSGGVVTRDGGALGVDRAAGRRAAISWRAAEGGVLAVGAAGSGPPGPDPPGLAPPGLAPPGLDPLGLGVPGSASAGQDAPRLDSPGPGPAATSFQLVHAAIRRRKPVIAVDLTSSPWLAGSLAAVCAAADAPLYQFGEAGQASYEPVRGGDPVRSASLVLGMVDWAPIADQHRRACVAYLGDLFALLAIVPGDPREPVLDDVMRLLRPAALRARLGGVPVHHPNRAVLAERLAASASLIEADPGALHAVAGQLAALRSSAIGRWLCPGRARISLGQVLRERAVGLFTLDRAVHGPPATMIAGLVAFDAMAVFAELCGIPASGDGVVWFNGCETLDRAALAELIARGGRAGMTVLLTTTSESAAASLAGDVNVLAIHQLSDPAAAGQLAAHTGAGAPGGGPGAVVPGMATAAGPAGSPTGPAGSPAAPLGPAAAPFAPGAAPGAAAPAGPPAASPAAAVPGAAALAGPPAAPGAERPDAPAAARSGSMPHGAREVPAWAQRMPAPAAAGSSASPGAPAASPGRAGDHPFRMKGSPAVTADSLLGLREGAFTLVVKGPERHILPLCQAVPARVLGRQA